MIEACSNAIRGPDGCKEGGEREFVDSRVVVCYIYSVARHGEDWNENRIVGVSTRCTCIGVRKRKRERERGEEREKAEGLGARGGGKRELLDRDGDDRRVGLSCRRSHRMGSLPSLSLHLVASRRRPTVWFTLSHCVCMRAQLR